MERFARGLALLAISTLGGWPGTATAAPGDVLTVNGLRIEGAPHLDDAAVKRGLTTTEPQPWDSLGPPHPFDLNDWQTDLARIQSYCRATGYYQCRVLFQEVARDRDTGVRLTVQLEEGEPTIVSGLDIRGLEAVPSEVREAVLRNLPLREGEVFREADWEKTKKRILTALRDQGYFQASVGGRVEVTAEAHRAAPTLTITPGLRFRFGKIAPRKTPPHVPPQRVADQVHAAIHPGDWFSPHAIEEARLRLFKMGVFADAKVVPGAPDKATATIPVEWEVEESLFHTQSVGLGFSVDPAQTEGHVFGEYSDLNLLGDLSSFYLQVRLGYALTPGVLATFTSPQSVESSWKLDAEAKLEQPGAFSPDVTTQVSLGLKRDFQPGFSYLEGHVKLGAVWQPRPDLYVFPSYNLELYGLTGTLADAIDGEHILGCDPATSHSFGGWSTCDVVLSYAEVVVELDRRDDHIQPHNGYFAALSIRGGGGPLGGDFNYLRVQPEARFYKTFDAFPRLTLSAKLKLGTLVTLGNTTESPVVARFSEGGANSMRGFGIHRLSPMLLVPPSADAPGASPKLIPIGGDGQLEASIEARYRITTTNLFGAVFLDVGSVTPGPFHPGDIARNMMYAAGVGVRYRTPVGPVRLDLVRRLDIGQPRLTFDASGAPAPAPEKAPSCFGLFPTRNASYPGAPQEGLCAFHLTVGEAF